MQTHGKRRIGFLIDWELSNKAGTNGKARMYARSVRGLHHFAKVILICRAQGTWAFMSVSTLMPDNIRHKFQDDMESFYYIVLYASVLWLPHMDVPLLENWVSNFFNESMDYHGQAVGGTVKESNRTSGSFYKLWRFKNNSLKTWLEAVRRLQWVSEDGKQHKWTPKALHDQWKSTDEEDLPVDDREDHIEINTSKKGKGKKNTATQPSAHASQISLQQSQSIDAAASTSSKRPASETGFEEHLDASRRRRNPARSASQKGNERM